MSLTIADSINSITKGFDLNSLDGAFGFTLHNAAQAGLNAGVSSAIYGTSFSDAFDENLVSSGNNVLSALAFNQVGNLVDFLTEDAGLTKDTFTYNLFVEGGLGRTALHSAVGGAVTEITSGDFATGAAAAGLNQIMSDPLSDAANALGGDKWRTAGAQLAGLAGAVAVDGDVNDGAWIAKQADTYNRQLHREELKLIKDNYKEYAEYQRRVLNRDITDGEALSELLLAALNEVDAGYDGNIRDNSLAAAFLAHVSDQSDLRLVSTDGQVTKAFEASAADYFNPLAYMDELYYSGMGLYEGGLDDQNLVRRVILDPNNAWALDANGGAYHNYRDTWIEANHYFADKTTNQSLGILGAAFATPVTVSAAVYGGGWLAAQGELAAATGLRVSQNLGASGYAILWSVENGASLAAAAGLSGAQSLGASGYAALWSAESAASLASYRMGTAVAGAMAPLEFYGGVAANGTLRLSQATGATGYAGVWRAEGLAAQGYWQTNVTANNVFNGIGNLGKVWAGGSIVLGFRDGLTGRYLGFENPPFSPGAIPGNALSIYNQAHEMGSFIGSVRDANQMLNEK